MHSERIADDAVVRVEAQLAGRQVRELADWWRRLDAANFPGFPQPEWSDEEACAFALARLAGETVKHGLSLPVPTGGGPVADESEHVARGLVR